MPTNPNIYYQKAEAKFLIAKTDEEKIDALEEMLRTMPSHKSAESLRKNIRTRHRKLREKIEASKKKKKSAGKKLGIKKEEMQAVIVGLTNSGKSSLLSVITNATPEIAPYNYTTKQPNIGAIDYEGCKIQIIDMPAIENEICDLSLINTADTLIIVVDKPEQLQEIFPFLENSTKNRIIIFNKSDLLSSEEKRKISAFLQSKKYNFILVSCKTKENINELKEKIWKSFGKIRVYTKEPGKQPDMKDPLILQEGSTVKDAAEKILHGLSEQVKETKVTGPSSKFPNQKVGLEHILKDKDVVEFHTK